MLYSFLRIVARIIFWIVNGPVHVKNADRIPKGNYILVGPHRTWFDPLIFALAASPTKFTFLAKKELFQNPIMNWILTKVRAVKVDRQNPGPSVIKTPVKMLLKNELSIIMYPSGTRHSEQLKGGVVLMAKLSGVPIVPAVYQGPLSFKRLFSRKKMIIDFGNPIIVDRKMKLNEENQKKIEDEMEKSFDKLDNEINPNFHYVDISKKNKNVSE